MVAASINTLQDKSNSNEIPILRYEKVENNTSS
jgi:hypothetical protein